MEKGMRFGLNKTLTKKQKNRIYSLNKNMKRFGHKVEGRSRTIILKCSTLTEKESKIVNELISVFDYCIQNPMFEEKCIVYE